jgi:phenylacetate-CoA ligase
VAFSLSKAKAGGIGDMIWNTEIECASRERMARLQGERLKRLLHRVYSKVPFYRGKMQAAGMLPENVACIEDIAKLPFTGKDELRDTYPYGLLAVDKSEIEELHSSSGTTGTPVVGAYTINDIDMWSEAMARCLAMAGTGKGDVVQNAYGYGLFTGGFGVHYGARKIGAHIIPASAGNTKRQIMLMRDFGTKILTCTPSFALYLADVAKEEGIDILKIGIKSGIFGAEPWTDEMRMDIQKKLGLEAFDIYGLTEIVGPGVSCECEAHDGLHVMEDLFYPEIIDPASGQVLPDGQKGELVFTTLDKEGTPLLRYRTRDITYLMREPCKCGRTTVRMHRIMGRTDDLLIVRGVNVFPTQIEQVLLRTDGVEPHYQIVVDRGADHLDELEVRVEMSEALFSDETRDLEMLKKNIEHRMRQELGISVDLKLVEPKSIPRVEVGKAVRVVDKRNLYKGGK